MHSYLIIGYSPKDIKAKIQSIVKNRQVFERSVKKISEVRELNSYVKLKISKPTVMILNDFHESTVEAQSAFLKNLEEPQQNLSYILIANNPYSLLPTITSRCQIINLVKTPKIQKSQLKNYISFANMSKAQKLIYINSIKGREEGKEFLKNIIIAGHGLLIKDNHKKMAKMLKNAQIALNNLKAYGNVSLQLTDFIIKSF